MSLTVVALFAALSIQTATPPQAHNHADAPTSAPAPTAKEEKPKKICRSIEKIGSRMPRRECKTEAEWQIADREQNRTDQVFTRTSRN